MTKLSTKPIRRCVHAQVPHGCKSEIVVTIYPNNLIGFRESGRALRTEQTCKIGELYVTLLDNATRDAERLRKKLIKEGVDRKQARKRARKECGL